jgi:AraC-like DNA-binding protein
LNYSNQNELAALRAKAFCCSARRSVLRWAMDQCNLYNLLFEQIKITTKGDGQSQLPRFAKLLRRSSPLGCLIQACDQHIATPLKSECVARPSLFISVVLSAEWRGGEPLNNLTDVPYVKDTLLAVAMREPVFWEGETPRCERLRVAGLGIPAAALEALGLGEEFNDLFDDSQSPLAIKAMKVTPRIAALGEDLLSPPVDGDLGRLLTDAHATEILARTLSAFVTRQEINALNGRDRVRLQRVRDLLDSDLSHAWTLAEVAQKSGVGVRSLNTKFRAAFGMTVFEYLKRRRLEFAHEALIQRQVSVSEIAYQVGYENPANFTTAFRRHFGVVPSTLRKAFVSRNLN